MAKNVFLGLGMLLILSTLLIYGCVESPEYQEGNVESGKSTPETTEPSAPGTTAPTKSLEILEHKKQLEDIGFGVYTLYIIGKAKNVGTSTLSYAEVRAKFYDRDGSLLSNSFDNINDLGAGETWNFKIMYLGTEEENVADYKIAVGTTW